MYPGIKIALFILLFPTLCDGQDLVILHTNDLHSRLNGSSPESEYTPLTTNDDPTLGGFARIASVITTEKTSQPLKVLTVDAGDFLMGTLFHTLEPTSCFQLRLMHQMGYDAVALGNHEFDFGTKSLADMIEIGRQNKQLPKLMLSNIQFNTPLDQDSKLESFYLDSTLNRTCIMTKNGYRIGLFSLIGKDAGKSANNTTSVTFEKTQKCARRMVSALKKQHVDLIIALSHSGIKKGENDAWEGEDVDLASEVDGINLIISGHSHTKLLKPLKVKNTYICQNGAYGSTVGKIEVRFNNHTPEFTFSKITVDDKIMGDTTIQSAINRQEIIIKNKILKPLGLNYNQNIFETDFPLVIDRQSKIEHGNLGPFIADAILNETNRLKGGNTNIAMIPAGMIRGNILPGYKGRQTTADLFNTLSLGKGNDSVPGYALSRVFLTGSELKKIVEVLLIAYQNGASKYMYYSGIRVIYNPAKFYLKQVQSLEIKNERAEFEQVDLNDSKRLYGLVGNTYLLNFVHLAKKMSFGLIQITPKDINGHPIKHMSNAVIDFDIAKPGIQEGKEWMAVIHYSETFSDINNNGIPDVPIAYKEKTNPVYLINTIQQEEALVDK